MPSISYNLAVEVGSLNSQEIKEFFDLVILDLHSDGLLVDLLESLDKKTQDILSDAVSNSIA